MKTYHINPSFEKALCLEEGIRTKLKESLLHIIDVCESFLMPEKLKLYHDKILSLCKINHVSPSLYVFNSAMLDIINTEKEDLAVWCLSLFEKYTFQTEGIELVSSDYFADQDLAKMFYLSDQVEFYDQDKKAVIDHTVQENYDRAVYLLKTYLEDFYGEFIVFNKVLLVFEEGNRKMGSSFKTFGFSYYKKEFFEISAIDVLDRVIHELGHHYLYALSSSDCIILNDSAQKYKNPFRTDLRPMSGVYHGTLVLCRILMMLAELKTNCSELTNFEKTRIAFLYEKYLAMFLLGKQVIEEHGVFTKNGEILTKSMFDKEKLFLSTN